MLDSLFSEGQYGLRVLFASIVVLGLIGLTAWLVRRFGAARLGVTAARGRQPRLAVIDAAAVDGRRRLILIRRDNVEHLLMIGGPSDIVVEANIVRATAASRDAAPSRPSAEPISRPAQQGEGWPLQPEPPRPLRPLSLPVVESTLQWPLDAEPAPSPARQSRDPLAGIAPEQGRPEPGPLPRPVRERPRERDTTRDPEPARAQQPATETPFTSAADQNLAEMAQRLEAALRRPAKAETRSEPAPQITQITPMTPMTPPAQPASHPAPEMGPELAPAETKPAPIAAKPAREAKPAPPPKSLYDNLEQEMASLLGRPNKKS